MTKIDKKYIYIDAIQRLKEKHIPLEDFPVYDIRTGRRLKYSFNYYFKGLRDYFASKNPKYLEWDDKYKYTSQEAYEFFEAVEQREYRCLKYEVIEK